MVVAVLCILFGGIALIGALMILAGTSAPPVWVDPKRMAAFDVIQAITFVDAIVMLVCGINFMQGANWARWLFLADSVLSIAIHAVLMSDKLNACVTTFGFQIICVVVLFLPASNEYFSSRYRR
jgi:hypothetical protein